MQNDGEVVVVVRVVTTTKTFWKLIVHLVKNNMASEIVLLDNEL